MPRKKKQFLRYILKKRGLPSQNRRRVGQSLILLTVFLFFVFLINFAIIIGTDSKFGVDLSEGAQQVHQKEVTVQAKRGTIYDRTGYPIAQDSTTYTIFAILDKNYVSAHKEILYVEESQFDKVADIFHEFLGMEKDYVLQQLRLPDLNQVYFGTKGKNISHGTMTAIAEAAEAANIKGISFSTSPGRLYTNGVFASHFIGLAQLKDNDDGSQSLHGQTGVEAALNHILSGQDGKIIYEKDSYGRLIPGTETVKAEIVDGKDIYTTLSSDLQRSLEKNMDVFYGERTKGVYANATLMSAKTGEILATTQRPTFDPDTKEGLDKKDLNWNSTLYQGFFEPGSTMKVMTLAAAIDNKTFNPNEYYTNNTYTLADAKINDWTVNEGRPPQTLTFANGFALSSNVGMTMLEQRMGDARWLSYLSKFRFGYPTRFGMNNEDGGIFPADNIVTIAMSSFGQGISVTNTQMLRAFSAIGNHGVMLQPKFISGIYDPLTDSARIAQPEIMGKPVSTDAANQTLQYMVTVGTDPYYGTLYSKETGAVIQVDGYNIAVKSGTAEIAKENGIGYMEGANDTINSVVAMVPAEDPEFIMYVTVQQPQHWSLLYWQDIVNPVLKEAMLLKDSLNLTGASPALASLANETEYKLPNIIGESPGKTADELRRNLVQPVILGNGSKIEKVSKKVGSNLAANQQVLLLTNNFEDVPDMYGWTKNNVEKFSSWTDINIDMEGSGSKVIGQSVEVGTNLKKTKKITITLGE
ncbi:penicillin-binding protein [Streptococcus minor]|uniref:Penicillin-binding protein n=1 Tax=Streptococcus minor TaxID=229549 RepID=A0A3P1VDM5_9STRE|nr:penicillin-binding protein PBP2X [Streptococcus minor]RRD31787.1 penicillin-binding protein [Streptococcus minor]